MLRRHGSVGVCYGEFEDMDQQPEPAIVSVLVVLRKPGNARIGSSLFEACAS